MRGTKVETSPGVWRFRVFVGSDPVTGNPRQVSRTFRGTKRQTDSALAAFVAEVVSGPVPATSSVTVGQYVDRWIDHITPKRSPTTIRGYRAKAKRISARLGSVRLDRLSAQHLDRAYQAWLDEGLDASSVHHIHRVLSASLTQAVKWGLIPYSPASRASPPARRTPTHHIPTVETILHLIGAAEEHGQPILATAIALAATTGMRRGELAGLRWDDVDLDNRRLQVRRSIKNDLDGGWVSGPTKTHQQRGVALDAFTVEVLRRHRADASGWADQAGVTLPSDGYVLTFDPTGTRPMAPDSMGQAFARLCRREGIDGLTLHSLRHFSASTLIASGRDMRTIAGRLGHADATTTVRVYADLVDQRDQDAADFLGALIASALPGALGQGEA